MVNTPTSSGWSDASLRGSVSEDDLASLSSMMHKYFPKEVDGEDVDEDAVSRRGKITGGLFIEEPASSDKTATRTSTSTASKKQSNTAVDEDAGSGYELTVGTTSTHFCRTWLAPNLKGPERAVCITQEFGTVGSTAVGRALVDENYAHFHGTEEEKALYGKRLRDCFYISEGIGALEWQRNVVRRGLKVFQQV